MRRGTTPTIKFKLPFKTENIAAAEITFSQKGTEVLTKQLEQCSCGEQTLTVTLTQQETLQFCNCEFVKMQIRVRMNDGTALASNIMECFVDEILKDGVI